MTNRSSPLAAQAVGVPARLAALRLLDAVLRRGLPLEAALDSATAALDRPEDRGLARAIASETLRRLGDLDALIDTATPRPLPADAKARFALRIALVQALALNTPHHAAIGTVLPLVEGGPRRLVHGVFGTIMRGGAALPDPPYFPDAVANRWRATWGDAAIKAARAGLIGRPPLDLTLRDPTETALWAQRLDAVSLAPGHLRRAPVADVTALPGYDEGAWWVQDLSASLPARLLGSGAGTALDLCAAPGGKTLQLAAAGWKTIAVETAENRLARLSGNIARVGLHARTICADIMTWQPPAPADAVLLDAPCSATGIFRRHPDVLHRVRPRAIADLADRQRAMLSRAAQWVKPGGRLVYAVCSLEREEGEAIVEGLADPSLVPDPITSAELPEGLAPDAAGLLRIAPGTLADRGGCDGFFVARFRKA